MVGVVTIGLSAALPELTTVFEALRRRTPNVAVGTLLGSNVVNPLLGVGLGAAISGYQVPGVVQWWDLPYKLAVAILLLAYMHYVSDDQLTREQGVWLVAAYFAYVAGRLLLFAGQ
jgi:cation:H+ antiporter